MSDRDTKELGRLLQEYARARWGSNPDGREAERLSIRLDRTFRDRIEMLGMDVERLLGVDPDQVLPELQALEREAALEDAGARSTATGVRAGGGILS